MDLIEQDANVRDASPCLNGINVDASHNQM